MMDTELNLESEHSFQQSGSAESFSQPLVQLLPTQQKNLELLSHLASYSELLIAVSGPAGVGKTTLANALSAHRETPEDTITLQADLMTSSLMVLQKIALSWDLPLLSDNLVEAKEAVLKETAAQSQDGRSLLIIIDQAEQLDDDTLNEIAHLALLAPQSLSFALFGASGFETRLRESPTQAPVHTLKPEMLPVEDAILLVEQVFGSEAVNDKQLQAAYSRSEGLPGVFLKALEDQLLATDNSHHPLSDKSRFPLLHIVAVAAVATALGLSFLYQSPESQLSEPQLPESQLSESKMIKAEQELDDTLFAEQSDSVSPTIKESAAEVIFQSDEKTDLITPEVAVVGQSAVAAAPEEVSVEKVPAVDKRERSDEVVEEVAATDFNYQSSTAKSEATPVTKSEEQPAVAAVAKVTSVAQAPGPVTYSTDEQQLLDASGFVAQLLGSHKRSGANDFIERWQSKLKGRLYLYHTTHKGKDWHVVVAGMYPDRTAAKAAVLKMPKALRDQSPWIRNVQSVQEILKSRK